MTPRQSIFISAASRELCGARELVAKTLYALGYEPIYQDVPGTDQGDLREMLRSKIRASKGVVQLVGHRYGAEPPVSDPDFGRVSYTQFEALHARRIKLRVWYLIDTSPPDANSDESEELRRLQADYRERIRSEEHLYHEVDLSNRDALAVVVHGMKDDLARLRRSFRVWSVGVIVMLLAILGLLIWSLVRPGGGSGTVTPESADAAFMAKNHAGAFNAYVRLAEKDPDNLGYHRRIEESARLGGLQKPMLDHYLKLVREHPGNAMFHNYLGNAYLLIDPADHQGQGREHYESALRLDPGFAPPLANLGILAARTGNIPDAKAYFERYLTAQPQDSQAWVNLGLLHLQKVESSPGDSAAVTAADTALATALRLDPGSATAYKAIARLRMACGRRAEAADACHRSLGLDPDQPDVRAIRAMIEGEPGDKDGITPSPDDLRTRGASEPPTEHQPKSEPKSQ